uniref:MAK10-like protein n=1 Tax=Tanacetum cinerariifolium TaxID=118510 RepID=A0A6L2LHG5_TANCI|nr:MAK10-like protein [Tanacetum cinerariifolium]
MPLRSDTIRLVQNGCSFHGHLFEDSNQHLKDFLKLGDSLDLNGENRERTHLRLFQFSLRDQASNWLERRTVKLHNDILMFQQHHEESLSEAWTRFKDLLQKAGGKLRDRNAKESWALLEDLALYDNESWKDPRDFAKPVKAITLPQDVPSTSDHRLIELENQVQRLMEAHLGPTQPTQVNKITTPCEICSGPRDTQYSQMNFTSTDYHTKEVLQSKGIKSPSKLLSLKYLSQSSIIKQNKNPSSPKPVHFVNSIVILNKESKEEGSVEPSKTNYTNQKNANETDEEFESEKEVEEETEGETKEEEEDNPEHFNTFLTIKELRYHEWLLKNPRPLWVKAEIRTGNVNNVKFSCRIDQFNKEQDYLDLESLINIMSRLHYNLIMSNRNFTYECYFLVLKDTTSVIEHYLGLVVFRKPFVEETGLVYNKEEGTIVFEIDKEKIMFKMPHKMDMFKHIDFTDISTDHIPPFIVESDNDNREKTHYSDSLDLGLEYKYDELYLTRRSLEVLRKFHLTTLRGRFNQLSHVSSSLLSKPGEY